MITRVGYSYVYLSPHLDDVALSCGGRVWLQAQAGARVAVVTVFAGAPEPGDGLSPFAQSLHERWEQPSGAVRMRQEEDREALSVLGAAALHWPYTDCVYRTTAGGDFAYSTSRSTSSPGSAGTR